jgi:hypothetical protein
MAKYPRPMDPAYAMWRAWAADVRDRRGPFRPLCPAAAELGGLLARLLDSWEQCDRRSRQPDSAANLAQGLERSIETLVRRLLARGVAPPAMPGAVVREG